MLACFLLASLFVRVSCSTEPVVVEFLYLEPCPTCPVYQEYYEIHVHNVEVVNDIQEDYGSSVLVEWIDFFSEEGLDILDNYNVNPGEFEDYWNAFVIDYEVIIEGYANETYVRELIDMYLMPVHDVAILSVVPASSSVSLGDSLGINVTVKNEGEEVESFNVTLYYNSSVRDTHFVDALEPATEDVLIFQWETQDVTEGNYTISAQADIVQNETDIDDNWCYDGIVEVRAPSTPPTIRHDVGIIEIETSNAIVEARATLGWWMQVVTCNS